MLECFNLDILPYSPDIAFLSVDAHRGGTAFREPLQVQDPDDWCIFSVEVRNTYGIPFEVTLERLEPGMLTTFDRTGRLIESLQRYHRIIGPFWSLQVRRLGVPITY